jgi:hypothetical protein
MTHNEQLKAAWAAADKKNAKNRNTGTHVTVLIQNEVIQGNKIVYRQLKGEDGTRFFVFIPKNNRAALKSLQQKGWTLAPKPLAVPAAVETTDEAPKVNKGGRPKKEQADEI